MAFIGDPLAREALVLRSNILGLEDPSRWFAMGRRSGGGEAVKHSSSEAIEELKQSTPAPNLKGGRGFCSCALKDTVLVE